VPVPVVALLSTTPSRSPAISVLHHFDLAAGIRGRHLHDGNAHRAGLGTNVGAIHDGISPTDLAEHAYAEHGVSSSCCRPA
jgi:hypothetical protein